MSDYITAKVNISEGQKKKLHHAIKSGCPVSIRLNFNDLRGEDILALTKSQSSRLNKAFNAGKGVTIKMTLKQLKHNMKVEGG